MHFLMCYASRPNLEAHTMEPTYGSDATQARAAQALLWLTRAAITFSTLILAAQLLALALVWRT